ncbi:MAG: histidine phosphatase family protein [Spirochaetes bacterium]|nr:histidine phosphatase family protein [Spirochaetota bacterium]
MKHIFILRHAKSDWSDASLDDFERPLNSRGLKAAETMGKYIKSLPVQPEVILSSPAMRAKMTVEIIKKHLKKPPTKWFESFYFGNEEDIIKAIKQLSDPIDNVLIAGHNPILEDLTSLLVSDGILSVKLPTASLVMIEVNTPNWKSLSPGGTTLKLLVYPKALKI